MGHGQAERLKEAGIVADLKGAKSLSDRRDYKGKHRILRKLLDERPQEFHIDSAQGPFVGVTHGPSGFRMHLPRRLVAAYNLPATPMKAAAPLPRAVLATLPRVRPRRPAAPPRAVAPVEPEPEPIDAAVVLRGAARSLRASRRRARLRAMQSWSEVPNTVATKVAGALPSLWPQGDPLADPAALASRIALGAQALPEPAAFSADALLGKSAVARRLFSKAALDPDTTGLFTPSIPVDAFNNVVWTDAWKNPFGSRSTFGDNSQAMTTPPEVAAAVTGLVAGAGASRDSSHVSPWDVAMAAGAAAGKGWLGGLVLGKTVGALAGMPPSAQKKLQDVGLWGGLLTGAVRSVFGGSH